MAERQTALHIQIAQEVFGWQWRDDWQAWCPPGWSSRTGIGYWQGQRYQEQMRALRQHGGAPYGRSGTLDERGRPVIPSYQYAPDATEILWNWLYHQPGVQCVQFVPLPLPPERVQGVRRWRCAIALAADRLVTSEGDSHKEALCRAVLALAHALRQQAREAGLADDLEKDEDHG